MTTPASRQTCFPDDRLAYSVKEFARLTNFSRSSLYEALREGSLIARKNGARTVILASNGMAWLKSLPSVRSGGSAVGKIP
jgi:hypothetical protein